MTIEQLRNIHQANPFRPFSIHLADGRQLPVPHREFLSHSPSGRTVIVYQEDDSFSVVNLLLVTELHVQNGSRPRVKAEEGLIARPCSSRFLLAERLTPASAGARL